MTLLFVVICVAFVGLGLPDSLLGAIWPVARAELAAPLAAAGFVSALVCCGTIVSSLASARLTARFGPQRVTTASVALTAVGVAGYALSPSLWCLLLFALPLGVGAGSVDAALNSFVALHFEARHMNWLHCFWGVGATLGPVIVSRFIAAGAGWRAGAGAIAVMLAAIACVVLLSFPLWRRAAGSPGAREAEAHPLRNREVLRIPGVFFTMLSFFCYSGVELTTGLWAASYLAGCRGLAASTAAGWVSAFYIGIAAGRLVCGFISARVQDKALIRAGCAVAACGIALLALPLPSRFCFAALILLGLGCAPIFPCIIHDTPRRAGPRAAHAAIGLEMATAYAGNTLIPPLAGLLAQSFSVALLPALLFVCLALLVLCNEAVNLSIRKRERAGGRDTA